MKKQLSRCINVLPLNDKLRNEKRCHFCKTKMTTFPLNYHSSTRKSPRKSPMPRRCIAVEEGAGGSESTVTAEEAPKKRRLLGYFFFR